MITIDGSYGEGGGQILRTALALSLVTGQPFRIENIRAGRKRSGLMRQHLTAVNAAAEIGRAQVSGNAIGSKRFTFEPKAVQPGRYHYAIGTAGSCTLVLQAVLPALLVADGPSEILLEGGTHNPFAPPFDFLTGAFLPLINRMGPQVAATLERPGFFPAGGGRMRVSVSPAAQLKPLILMDRGQIKHKSARAVVSNLSINIARRELKVVADKLGWEPASLHAVAVEKALGPGNVMTLEIESNALTEVFTGFGERGVSAERVAGRVVKEARDYTDLKVAVGGHLADQLLVPLAIAGGGKFSTMPPSRHTTTNVEIIKQFMNIKCDINADDCGRWQIELRRSFKNGMD